MKIKDYPKTIVRKDQYTSGDLAIVLGISHRTAAKLIDAAVVNSFRLPNSHERRIHDADLRAFLSSDAAYHYALAKITEPTEIAAK